ncbi:histidine phosphatase family protein [Candidatus Woesearchaeota archaeon]|nr:histidine phosphatase family protein [Candidatus Woesearchaeota archaeon]
MIEATIIRHASTPLNEKRIIQGSHDVDSSGISIGLSDRGKWEVDRLVDYFRHQDFDAVYAGTHLRVSQTVEPIMTVLKGSPPLVRDARANERAVGRFSGVPYDQVFIGHHLDIVGYLTFIHDPEKIDPSDRLTNHVIQPTDYSGPSEERRKCIERCYSLYFDLLRHQQGKILVVTSNVTFQNLLGILTNNRARLTARQDNGCINKVTLGIPEDFNPNKPKQAQSRIEFLNYTAHMR